MKKLFSFNAGAALMLTFCFLFLAFQKPNKEVRVASYKLNVHVVESQVWDESTKSNKTYNNVDALCQAMYQQGWVLKSTLTTSQYNGFLFFER